MHGRNLIETNHILWLCYSTNTVFYFTNPKLIRRGSHCQRNAVFLQFYGFALLPGLKGSTYPLKTGHMMHILSFLNSALWNVHCVQNL